MARALEFLLLDLLLDEVLRVADGRGRARDGHDAVAGAGRERALLRDLDVGARHLLDLHQAAPAGACNNTTQALTWVAISFHWTTERDFHNITSFIV